jgi:hypothetical protein
MAHDLSTQHGTALPNNKELLSSARASLATIAVTLQHLERTHSASEALVSHIDGLLATDSSKLPEHLNRHIASARFAPPSDIAEAIRERTLGNLQQALSKLLAGLTPKVQSVQEHLTRVSASPAEDKVAAIAEALECGRRLCGQLTSLSSDSKSLDISRACTAELRKFILLSRQFSNSIGKSNLQTIAKEFGEQLDAHVSCLRDSQLATQAALIPPADSDMYRNILLATDLYELERHSTHKNPTRHILHGSDHVEGINALYRSLPEAHSIDTQGLAKALTAIVGEESLANSIAQTLIEKATWYQIEYPLVRSMLQLQPDQMDLLLTNWSLAELREFAHATSQLKIPARVASKALINDTALLTDPERTLTLLQDITEYFTQLTPLERFLPRISPQVSPELFLRHDSLQVAESWRARARDGTIPHTSLQRIAAEHALAQLLAPFLEEAKFAAPTLVYGFGCYSNPRDAGPSPRTLSRSLPTRRADFLRLGISVAATQDGIAPHRITACHELEKRGLFRFEDKPRKIKSDSLSEIKTKLAGDTQRALPPEIWEHTIAILEALHRPPEILHQLLNQVGLLTETHAPKVPAKSTSEQKIMIAAPVEKVHTLISDISQQLDALDREDKQHKLWKKVDRVATTVGKLKLVLSPRSGSPEPAVAELLEQLKFPRQLGPAEIETQKHTARRALTAISNLVMDTAGGIKA